MGQQQEQDAVVFINIPFVSEDIPFLAGHHLVGDREARMSYLDAVRSEAHAVASDVQRYHIKAIKVGGGSPSIMSPDKLGELLLDIRMLFKVSDDCEITMEATPHTVGVPALTGWGQGKVNRVTLHADSVQPEELVSLNRPYDSVQVQNALLYFDKFRLSNVDVDLLYGVPGQTVASLRRTIRSIAGIEPPHITLTPLLTQEEGVQGEQTQHVLYDAACERLAESDYTQYAAGKFARRDRDREAFTLALCGGAALVGLGIDARSRFGGFAYENTSDFATYVAHSGQIEHVVAAATQIDDLMRVRLFVRNRLTLADGFDGATFAQECGPMPSVIAQELKNLATKGWVIQHEDAWKLTSDGMFFWVR